jgi:hypothetical protein
MDSIWVGMNEKHERLRGQLSQFMTFDHFETHPNKPPKNPCDDFNFLSASAISSAAFASFDIFVILGFYDAFQQEK